MTTKKKPLSIYIHIPFCVRKCNYCDFLSGPATEQKKDEYIHALMKEIRSYHSLSEEYEIATVFLGGGTPSSIDAKYIRDIMLTLEEVFEVRFSRNKDIEVTIEINPGTITKEKLLIYKEVGINRISFGLQSTEEEELRCLGRIHTYDEFVANYQLARELGFDNINIDLMSALPRQTVDSYERTLNKVISLNPEHISAYSLIIEEGTPFYELYGEEANVEATVKLPSEEEERLMYERTRILLHEYGYERYEISNYAKPGYECKHNCTYWRRGDYLGLGSGSSSLIQHKRFSNVSELSEYIHIANDLEDTSQLAKLYANQELLTTKDEMEEFMFLGLRMMQGVSIKEFQICFEKDIYEVYGEVLEELYQNELLEQREGLIRLTTHGIDISNYVMSEFLLDS